MNSHDAYDWFLLAIQATGLGGLIYYAVETFKIRKSAQIQAESTLRPCVVLSSTPRPLIDAVLELDQTDSILMVRCPEGVVEIENIGVGPAFNLRYKLTPLDHQENYVNFTGYVAGITTAGRALLPIGKALIEGHQYDCVFTYESASGHKYHSHAKLQSLVITNVRFETK